MVASELSCFLMIVELKHSKNIVDNGQKTSRARKPFLTSVTKLIALSKLVQTF